MTNSMNRSNLLRRLCGGISVIATVAIITFSGCTDVDTSLGSNLTLENQAMKLGQMKFSGLEGNYFESKLYKTDSLNTQGMSYGYFGSMGNDTFGTRSAGFFTQYLVANSLNDDIFGYLPIFDSAVLYITIDSYGGDTSVVQNFEVFELKDNSFITESADSVFFSNFDIEPYIDADPVFTFKFPDQDNGVYTTSSYIKMEETDNTALFIHRLMLETITGDYDEDIYDDDEAWIEEFKGLYIRPVGDLEPITAGNNAAIFATSLESSGFGFFGRSREEVDHTIIKDTIGMTYIFYSSYADYGNVSINFVENNYDGSLINLDEVLTPYTADPETIPLTTTLRVEGMGGVVSQITLTEEFFEQLDTILEDEEEPFTSMFFNQAVLKIYMEGIDDYDVTSVDPYTVTPWMNVMPTSLGLYTRYASYYYEDEDDGETYTTLTGAADYLYYYESSYTLDFGGSLNRSWGCYVMNIPSQIQSAWNSYLSAKEDAQEAGTEIDLDDVDGRTLYLGPRATDLFSFKYASLQAGDPNENSAPIHLELTYTMLR
ncbi:MAG: DUF4270 family protein [Rikenellaceae bacterium]